MNVRRDAYGLPVTTTSAEAADAYDQGVRGLLAWDRRTVDFFHAALGLDPGFAVAHFVEEQFAEAGSAMAAADRAAAGASARERSLVAATALYLGGRHQDAEAAMRRHLAAHPTDLAVAQRLYLMWFYQGRADEMRGLTTDLAGRLPEDSFVLGLHAFALEETGDSDQALRWAEACTTRNAEDTWGVHALIHALYEKGQYEGLQRVPPAIDGCVNANYYRNHMLWHVVLLHLASGDYVRGSAMCREVFERQPSPVGLDLRNSISALWRLELYGIDTEARFQPFVAILGGQLDRPQDSPFHHAHIGMALAGGRDWRSAERHLEVLRARCSRPGGEIYDEVVLPLAEAQHAFIADDHGRVIGKMEPIRSRLGRLGGSRTQQDIFHDTLLEACFRAGDAGRAERYLAERLARRPEHFWLHRGVDGGTGGGAVLM